MYGHENTSFVGRNNTKRRKQSPDSASVNECEKCKRFYDYANELSYTYYEKCSDPWSCENLDVCDRCWHCRMVLCIQAGMVSQTQTNICPLWRPRCNQLDELVQPFDVAPNNFSHVKRKILKRPSANTTESNLLQGKRKPNAQEQLNSSEVSLLATSHHTLDYDLPSDTPRRNSSLQNGVADKSYHTAVNRIKMADLVEDNDSETFRATSSLSNTNNSQIPGNFKLPQKSCLKNTNEKRQNTTLQTEASRAIGKCNQAPNETVDDTETLELDCSESEQLHGTTLSSNADSPKTPGTSKNPQKSGPKSTNEKANPQSQSTPKQLQTAGLSSTISISNDLSGPCLILYTDTNFQSIYKRHMNFATMCNTLTQFTLDNQATIHSLFGFYDWEWNKPDLIPDVVQRACWSIFQNQVGAIASDMSEFIESFPGLCLLRPKDRYRLIQGSVFEIAFVLQFLYVNTESCVWQGEKYFVLTIQQLRQIFPSGTRFFNDFFINSKRMEPIKQDHVALGLIAMALLADHTHVPSWSQEAVARIRGRIIEALKTMLGYITCNLKIDFVKILRIIRCLKRLGKKRQKFSTTLQQLGPANEESPN